MNLVFDIVKQNYQLIISIVIFSVLRYVELGVRHGTLHFKNKFIQSSIEKISSDLHPVFIKTWESARTALQILVNSIPDETVKRSVNSALIHGNNLFSELNDMYDLPKRISIGNIDTSSLSDDERKQFSDLISKLKKNV